MTSVMMSWPHWRRLAGDRRATSAVEFALIAPLLFLLLFGIVTFGVQYSARVALTHAAAEGGRAAQAGLTDDERAALARAAVQSALAAMSPLVDASKAAVTVTTADDAIGEVVTIRIAYSDARFAHMPFMSDLGGLAPVQVNFYVTDPDA